MRHRKSTVKLNRKTSHRIAMFSNMLKALIEHERIETTVTKAQFLKTYADKMITLAKANDLASRRAAISKLHIRYNKLTPKEARLAKEGDTTVYNGDRKVLSKLFNDLGPRFLHRNGGYTRLTKLSFRQGDNAQRCIIEYLPA